MNPGQYRDSVQNHLHLFDFHPFLWRTRIMSMMLEVGGVAQGHQSSDIASHYTVHWLRIPTRRSSGKHRTEADFAWPFCQIIKKSKLRRREKKGKKELPESNSKNIHLSMQ